jgi:hypothetical protein
LRALFIALPKGDVDDWKRVVRQVKNQAQQQGCQIAVFTVGVITCKPTRKTAEDYYRYCILEQADWKAMDNILGLRNSPLRTIRARTSGHRAIGVLFLNMMGNNLCRC